ncbi:hypothetical protein EGH67_26790 [Klebsiella aerogenes]|nr:hypothetical protein AM345_02825 [Klebsiella aerogenes]OQR42969.1 hypothetical protein BW261_23255 [Klebsiella aerogenes]PYZ46133.1 hypothetical protein DNK66_09800 [Klebsiella aerogenes]RFP72051.1 hypothetical protein D0N43_20425 [Klebsiella aerogenes]RSV62937.1 hypothetical protein EGH60_26815 [Klebsiella aerogenes]
MLRCFMGLFNAQYQYHLHGMLRKPLRTALSSGFLHKSAHFSALHCISICYKKYLTHSVSINTANELFHFKVSFG